MGARHCIHIDALTDGDGSSYVDSFLPPPCNSVEDELFGTEDDEIARLRDFEEMLSGRLLDVFHLMLDRKSGGADHERVRTVALRWNVTERTVFNDEKRLKEMIMEFFEESSPVSAV